MMVFTTLLKITYNRKQQILYVITFGLMAMINILFIPAPYNTFVNVFLCPVLVFIIFRTSILKAILSQIIIYLVAIVVDTPIVLFETYLFDISSVLISQTPLYRIIHCCISYSIIISIYFLFIKNNVKIFVLDVFKKNNNRFLILNLIVGIITIALQYYIEFTYINYLPTHLVILSLLILVLYFLISLFSLSRTSKLEVTTENLEEEKLYNQTLTLLYDNIRGFKHDFNNIVQGIGGYISTNNIDGLKKYYSEILDDCQRVNNLSLLSPEVINNPAIYSLLTSKYHTATELGIKITLEIFMDLSTINMKIYELTRVLGILIDNAIEAAKECSEKEIIITFRKDNKRNKQLFIIENTYSNKDINIDEIFEKGKTSKKNEDAKNHGLGLWEVRQFMKKNKNLDLYTTKSEKYFKQQFEIYC